MPETPKETVETDAQDVRGNDWFWQQLALASRTNERCWKERDRILAELAQVKDALERAEAAIRAHHRVEERMNGDGTCAVCGPSVWAMDDAQGAALEGTDQ